MTESVRGHLPAEWELQSAIMLTWPRGDGDFARNDDRLAAAETCLAQVAAMTSWHQRVLLVTENDAMNMRVATLIASHGGFTGNLEFAQSPADDIWARDHGPVTLAGNGPPVMLDFLFDGWGGRYPAGRDNAINANIHALGAFGNSSMLSMDRVLEGGAIDTDGAGTLMTTRRWLDRQQAMPGNKSIKYINCLADLFDINNIIILQNGEIVGDQTDGHVDMLARFTGPGAIVYQSCEQPDDPHCPALTALGQELKNQCRPDGLPYNVYALPFPGTITNATGERLPVSYANFLITNRFVFVPGYQSEADEAAREIIAGLFPNRRAITIDCRVLSAEGGGLHCATMQLPDGIMSKVETN